MSRGRTPRPPSPQGRLLILSIKCLLCAVPTVCCAYCALCLLCAVSLLFSLLHSEQGGKESHLELAGGSLPLAPPPRSQKERASVTGSWSLGAACCQGVPRAQASPGAGFPALFRVCASFRGQTFVSFCY